MSLTAAPSPFLPRTLPTNYEYYTSGGINSGLNANQSYFTFNDRNISIYSGAMHYFRVPRPYWRDRLRKMRAAGLNTVETYVAWNLHEPRSGEFDFGNGGNDMSDFLHLDEFIETAKEEDLFVIVRPGPFICAEFEFGGFPSWLLREDGIEVRTSNSVFMKYVTRYFNVLLTMLAALQFTVGGPIIMFQVENEYANSRKKDKEYLRLLREQMLAQGIRELLVTADNPDRGKGGTISDLFLMTGTFYKNSTEQLNLLSGLQPGRPLMAMEYYPGWFDFWGRSHNRKIGRDFEVGYANILKYPASVNIYMFHGGTNFGFMNGAQNLKLNENNTDYHSITTSYEYNAPISESGQCATLYYIIRDLLAEYSTIKTHLPDIPENQVVKTYEPIRITKQMSLKDALTTLEPIKVEVPISMERLDINNNSGQSYGYIVYRKSKLNIPAGAVLQIEGRVCDTVMVLVNGEIISPFLESAADLNQFGTSVIADSTLLLTNASLTNATLDLVVENWGRINVAVYQAFKGLWQGGVKLNQEYLHNWEIFPLEFKKSWTNNLRNWEEVNLDTRGPTLYKVNLQITEDPYDTFLYMENWTKGIVVINGFVLGRYARMGPVQTMYLPAVFLKKGENDIMIFEHFTPNKEIAFVHNTVYINH